MWALGVTIYMWVFGELPFNGAAPFMVYESIRRNDVRLPTHTRISKVALCDVVINWSINWSFRIGLLKS